MLNGGGDRGGESDPESEIGRLNRVDDQPPWCPVKYIGEPDRLGDTHPVRARRLNTRWHRAESRAVDVAGVGMPGQDRIDDHRQVGVSPRVDQLAGLAVTDGDSDIGLQLQLGKAGDDGGPDTIVTAVLVADTDHRGLHRCSTVSSRKWVEHEMHGS
jgi:hypothetical protein